MNKKLIIILGILVVAAFSFYSCNTGNIKEEEQQRQEKHAQSSIEFYETEFDFGSITGGEYVSHRFLFKNTGNTGLFVSKVESDCGCTITDYEKKEIKPEEEAYIEVVFDSNSYHGLQIKKVKVYTNTNPAVHELTIAATVE